MTLYILASTGFNNSSWAKLCTIRSGLWRAQVCDDAGSSGLHCKIKFKG